MSTGIDYRAMAKNFRRLHRDSASIRDSLLKAGAAEDEAQRLAVEFGINVALVREPGEDDVPPDEPPHTVPDHEPVKLVYVADALRSLAATPPLVPVPTGIEQLDALLDGGLRAKRLYVLCGPPGAGKTAFVGELTRRMRTAVPVLLCSTEIEPDEQAARLVAPAMGASADSILRHTVSPERGAKEADGWPVALVDLDAVTESDVDPLSVITLHVDALAKAHGKRPIVIVDYLQDLVSFDPERRRLGVSSMARRLRQLARNLDVPLLACSSVSRAHYGGAPRAAGDEGEAEDPRAWLAAAKESGDIEFAAAGLMYLDTSPAEPGEDAPARVIVAKARMGQVGFVGLRFDGARGAFHESSAALASMGKAARNAEDDGKVLAEIGRWRSSPKPWREIRTDAGIAGTRADRARKRLLAAGRLVERAVLDTTGPRRVRKWLIPPEWTTDPLPFGMADAPSEPE